MTGAEREQILEFLATGEVELLGLLPWGSNYTFLVKVCRAPEEMQAIYKPQRGERPLWDFPRGTLFQRERAAFLVSDALGWHLVPPTVLRDGPHGPGAVQYFVDHDPERHYFNLDGPYEPFLQKIALFDVLVNNADRKGGHVLLDNTGRLWSIDHGICFHVEYKLRSVIWDFAGEPIPAEVLADLSTLEEQLQDDAHPLYREMRDLLSGRELRALHRRTAQLLKQGHFPHPGPGRHYPWPPV